MTYDLLGGIISYVNSLTNLIVKERLFPFIDDIIRQFLSEIDKLTFVLCQQNAGNSLVYVPAAVFIVTTRIIPSRPGCVATILASGHVIDGLLSS